MSQEVKIAGALFSNVPSIQVPDSNNVYHSFVDTSDTTAAAADVASGKYFYTSAGVKTAGTSSGGTTELKMGVLRPDAEIVQTYSYDKYIVADEGVTLPSYATTLKTLKSSSTFSPTVSMDLSNYDYYVLGRLLTIPSYSITTVGKGREEYIYNTLLYEIVSYPGNTYHALVDPTKKIAYRSTAVNAVGNVPRLVYYKSGTELGVYSSGSYGATQGIYAPTEDGGTLTLKSPELNVRGHATYFTSTYFNALTDIRYQYIYEVYRAPKNNLNLDGWGVHTQAEHILDCIDNGGTLT